MATRKQILEAQIAALADQVAELTSRPAEPDWDEAVVSFTKTFGQPANFTDRNGRTRPDALWYSYSYAAVKASTGRWYVTGKQAPSSVTWDELLDFIEKNEETMPEIYVATEWTALI